MVWPVFGGCAAFPSPPVLFSHRTHSAPCVLRSVVSGRRFLFCVSSGRSSSATWNSSPCACRDSMSWVRSVPKPYQLKRKETPGRLE